MTGAYARVSTQQQAERQTIEPQKAAIVGFLGREPDEWFLDDGTTSRKPLEMRAGGARMFEQARAGKLTKLVVYMYDRLGRDDDSVTTLVAMDTLRSLGVEIVSVKEVSADTSLGRFVSSIAVLAGGLEREKIRDRARTHAHSQARGGVYQGGPTRFGYCVVARADERKELALATGAMPGFEDPPLSEVDVVRQVFERVAGDASQQTVADQLNARGIPLHPAVRSGLKPNGKRKHRLAAKWTASRIGAMIRESVYKGQFRYGRRKVVWAKDGTSRAVRQDDPSAVVAVSCPAIVTEELWVKANAALRSHNNRLRAHADNEYLLSGLIRCGTCGRAYTGATPNGRKIYHCGAHYGYKMLGLTKPCPSPNVNGRALEGAVLDDLAMFRKNPGPTLRALEESMTSTAGKAGMARESKRLEQQLAEQGAERDRLLTMYRKGLIDEAQLERQYGAMAEERAGWEAEIARLRQELDDDNARRSRFADALSLLERLGKDKGFVANRAAAEALVGITIQTDADGRPQADITYVFEPHFERVKRGWALAADDLKLSHSKSVDYVALAKTTMPRRCCSNPCSASPAASGAAIRRA